MPAELILYTSDHGWKVEIEAWASALRLYSSIGTKVTVYRKEEITSMWGTPVSLWVGEPASLIRIRNVYSGIGGGRATREREWRNAMDAELKQWTTGKAIHVVADSSAGESSAPVLDVNMVQGSVSVVIGHETLSGVVSATSVSGARVMPAAA